MDEWLLHFSDPPAGYGVVPFYWWLGDSLRRDRLTAQLDMMADSGITALQINYAHSDEGGRSFGLTYTGDPPLFSEDWWELFGWFLAEADARHISVGVSDYTLGTPGQGWHTDALLREYPDMQGQKLVAERFQVIKGESIPQTAFEAALCSVQITDERAEKVDIARGATSWTASADGEVVIVRAETIPWSLNPMHPQSGERVADRFYGEFERRFPDACGKSLNFFFSDELNFGISGWLWDDNFASAFQEEKGYDPHSQLYRLFLEPSSEHVAFRMDYTDVVVRLEQRNYFEKIYQWHQSRKMIFGCDHGGRGLELTEFGDYMRTQQYNQGPGCDQPDLASDIIKNKVAASISHVYARPRVWLEGFYGSGWGTTTAQLTDAIARNFSMGHNLLSLHGLYYSTHGGYWEWAPPCNGFHMPYWEHEKTLLRSVERLSYVMSTGNPVCRVAVLYPVAAVESGLDADNTVEMTFSLVRQLVSQGIDIDFVDWEMLSKATIEENMLVVGACRYQMLLLPPMRAVRASALKAAADFAACGGLVGVVGYLPTESDGRIESSVSLLTAHADLLADVSKAIEWVKHYGGREIIPKVTQNFTVAHRRTRQADIFLTYGIPRGEECLFAAHGKAIWLNCRDGKAYQIPSEDRAEGVVLKMPVEDSQFALIVIGEVKADEKMPESALWKQIDLPDVWKFSLKPVLDNTYGDFALPPTKGVMPVQVQEWQCGNQKWLSGYGGYFNYCEAFATVQEYYDTIAKAANGEDDGFKAYPMSWRYGLLGDPGHQGYHGLKGCISDDFLVIGSKHETMTEYEYLPYETGIGKIFTTWVYSHSKQQVYILTGELKPETLLINGEKISDNQVCLHQGWNRVIAGYLECGRTHLIFSVAPEVAPATFPLSMRWYRSEKCLHMGMPSSNPQNYSFLAPPAITEMKMTVSGKVISATLNGVPATVCQDGHQAVVSFNDVSADCALCTVTIMPSEGHVDGGVFEEPAQIFCGEGQIPLRDWSEMGALKFYSGGGMYHTTVNLEKLPKRMVLKLEEVSATASVQINGQEAGVLTASPWEWEITSFVHQGNNKISVTVYNTLGNYYEAIPTRYHSGIRSGIIGKAVLLLEDENGL